MQAKTTSIAKLTKLHRPNLVTADELNPILAELKTELSQLKGQFTELAATVTRLQQPVVVRQSARQQLRWIAIKAAKESLKAGNSVEDAKTFLGDHTDFQPLFEGTDKAQAIEGIIKIALVQVGQRNA
jgi:hypothetical protein